MDSVLKSARECRTKEQWKHWLAANKLFITSCNDSKLLEEIFKLLEKDAQSLQYGPSLWASLLDGCLSSWNLQLGVKIAHFTEKIKSPRIALPAAKIYLESGFPRVARQIVSHAQRLANIETKQKLQLDTINCSTYIEEGKRSQAARILKRIERNANDDELSAKDRADFLTYVARTLFLLGRYKEASRIFETIAEVYHHQQLWENAAKSLFNAAASLENAGEGAQDYAFRLVERCRRISEDHNLKGPLAHCEAFHGHNDYWRGNFAGAREHYRRALQHYPASDNSYRRLHLLSMLAFTYLRTGRLHLAQKFGNQTLTLASEEETDRFAIRYDNLEAELLWEQGKFLESQELLKSSTAILLQKGVHTLEDLAIVSRYIYQSALLDDKNLVCEFQISPDINNNIAAQQEYVHALAHHWLTQKDYDKAEEYFLKCLSYSEAIDDQYHRSLSYLGLVEVGLIRGDDLSVIESYLDKSEIHMGRMVETPLKNRAKIALAAVSYRRGDFERCLEHLRNMGKTNRPCVVDEFVAKTWISTVEGRSTRFASQEHEQLFARLTRIYFNPRLEKISPRVFTISNLYKVELDKHPSIAEFLCFLLEQKGKSSAPEKIQSKVWKQSIQQLGWQQKIRNTINRLRQLFPYTMAPLIIHDKSIRLFSEAIQFETNETQPSSNQTRILNSLRQAPHSSLQLASELNLSPATTKRLLKNLAAENKVTAMKIGRNIFYKSLSH